MINATAGAPFVPSQAGSSGLGSPTVPTPGMTGVPPVNASNPVPPTAVIPPVSPVIPASSSPTPPSSPSVSPTLPGSAPTAQPPSSPNTPASTASTTPSIPNTSVPATSEAGANAKPYHTYVNVVEKSQEGKKDSTNSQTDVVMVGAGSGSDNNSKDDKTETKTPSAPFSPRKKMSLNPKMIIGLLAVGLTLLGGAAGLFLNTQNQDKRSDASGCDWSCNNNCADAAAKTIFNNTWCDGRARWLYEAAGNNGSCGGNASVSKADNPSCGNNNPPPPPPGDSCTSGWSCNGNCADAAAQTIFNNTWCDGRARWLYEAAGNSTSCGGNASSAKSAGCGNPPPGGGGGNLDTCSDSSQTASACRNGKAVGTQCLDTSSAGGPAYCASTGADPDGSGKARCACRANSVKQVGESCGVNAECVTNYCRGAGTTTAAVCRPASERPGDTGGPSCAAANTSCETNPCCAGSVCQGAAGSRVCQVQQNVCGTGQCTGYYSFQCSNLAVTPGSNGVPVCEASPENHGSNRSAAITRAGATGCGQWDQVCVGGDRNGQLCGEFAIINQSCGTNNPPPPESPHPSPTIHPSPTPTPVVAPQCLNISLTNVTAATRNTAPVLGDAVRFTCGTVTGASRYHFRVIEPDSNIVNLEATSAQSSTYNITKAGRFYAQCQICYRGNLASSQETCVDFENIPTPSPTPGVTPTPDLGQNGNCSQVAFSEPFNTIPSGSLWRSSDNAESYTIQDGTFVTKLTHTGNTWKEATLNRTTQITGDFATEIKLSLKPNSISASSTPASLGELQIRFANDDYSFINMYQTAPNQITINANSKSNGQFQTGAATAALTGNQNVTLRLVRINNQVFASYKLVGQTGFTQVGTPFSINTTPVTLSLKTSLYGESATNSFRPELEGIFDNLSLSCAQQ